MVCVSEVIDTRRMLVESLGWMPKTWRVSPADDKPPSPSAHSRPPCAPPRQERYKAAIYRERAEIP